MNDNKINLSSIENDFIESLRDLGFGNEQKNILVAYSGGVDSSVLLHLTLKHSIQFNFSVSAVYFNHNLRSKESQEEEKYINTELDKHGIKYFIGTSDVVKLAEDNKYSIQHAARNSRYKFFDQVVKSNDIDFVFTAHHRDDQIESGLMAYLKGSNLEGLSGIPKERGSFVRPLLSVSKKDVLDYSKLNQVSYIQDNSNSENKYLRNRIRNEILPFLKNNLDSNVEKIIFDHCEKFKEELELINYLVTVEFKKVVKSSSTSKIILDINLLRSYFISLRKRVLLECLKLISPENRFSYPDYIDKINNFLNGTLINKNLYISEDIFVTLSNDLFTIIRFNNSKYEFDVNLEEFYSFDDHNFTLELKNIDSKFRSNDKTKGDLSFDEIISKDKVIGKLKIRSWLPGDKFIPLGMENFKKISDFFIDLKLDPLEKATTPILVDEEKIIWVCGCRIDNRVKLCDKTNNLLGLNYDKIIKN